MSLRLSELTAVAAELNAALAGAAVQKVWVDGDAIWLELRHRGAEGWRSVFLQLQRAAAVARVSIAFEKPPSSGEPPPFQRWLRQELAGARVRTVRLIGEDRIVRVDFDTEKGARAIVVELTGAAAIALLLTEADRVLAMSGHPGEGRVLRPGVTYAPPPSQLSDAARAQPSRLKPAAEAARDFPLSIAAEALYGTREKTLREDAIRRALVAPLKAKRTRTVRTLEKVRAEAARQPDAEEHRRLGELLAQNLFRVQRGQKTVTLTEYVAEGPREVEVKLDPTRTPKQEVDWRFHQYKRLLRGCEAAQRRQGELEAELAKVDAELARIAALSDEALREAAPATPAGSTSKTQQVAKPYREFVSKNGERILVGKGSRENDTLTFKVARPQDLWLHARGVSGSHVVIPLERNAELPQELLLDGAHLALHYSQRKGEPTGEVSYTHAKFVRKAKGAAAGAVTYTRDRTFNVRVEPARMERLLKSREGGEA